MQTRMILVLVGFTDNTLVVLELLVTALSCEAFVTGNCSFPAHGNSGLSLGITLGTRFMVQGDVCKAPKSDE